MLHKHESISLAAVVALPDAVGEVPCAFIELIDGKSLSEDEIESFAASCWIQKTEKSDFL